MKKIYLLMLFAVFTATLSGWADNTSTVTFSQASSLPKTYTDNDYSWTLSGEWINSSNKYFGNDGTRGAQFGSAKAALKSATLTSNGFSSKSISKIEIYTSVSGSARFTAIVKVGGTQVGSFPPNGNLTTTNTKYGIECSAKGEIEIVFTNSNTGETGNGALYLNNLTVTYSDDSSVTPPGPTDPDPEEPEEPEPGEGGNGGSYTIVFAKNTGDGTNLETNTSLSNVISEGQDYISSISSVNKAFYNSANGLKFGNSSNPGDVTFSLSDKGKGKVDKVVVNAATYKANEASNLIFGTDSQKLNTDGELADYTFNLNGAELSEIKIGTTGKRGFVQSITVYFVGQEGDKQALNPTLSSTTLTVGGTATLLTLPGDAPEVTLTSSNTDVVTVNGTTVTAVAIGSATVTATWEGNETYSGDTAQFTVTVTPNEGEVLTVAEAIAAIKRGYTGVATVKGIISEVTEVSSQYENVTFIMKDSFDDPEGLTFYRGKLIEDIMEYEDGVIEVGGTTTVKGELTYYNNTTPEVATGGQMLEYTAPKKEQVKYTGLDQYDGSADDITFEIGKSFQLNLGAKHPVIKYTYDPENVISIDANGLITALGSEADVVDVVATWEADDNFFASTGDGINFFVNVTEPQGGTDPEPTVGTGTQDNPYTIDQVLTGGLDPSSNVWVVGYIVGTMVNNNLSTSSSNAVNTNMAIAATADETKNIVPVELPSGSVRTNLNLKDHWEYVGKKIKLYGNLQTYFSKNGLKGVTKYEFVDEGEVVAPTTITFDPEGGNILTTDKIRLSADGTDPKIEYAIDDTQVYTVYSEPFSIETTETHTVYVKATNSAGSISSQATYNVSTPSQGGGETIVGTGTQDNPYTIDQVLAGDLNTSSKVWVVGYIIGTMVNNKLSTNSSDAVNTNMVIAATADETENIVPVELPKGDIRDELNLADHWEYVGKKIKLYGSLQTYFSKNGLKSVTNYEFVDIKHDNTYIKVPVLPNHKLYYKFGIWDTKSNGFKDYAQYRTLSNTPEGFDESTSDDTSITIDPQSDGSSLHKFVINDFIYKTTNGEKRELKDLDTNEVLHMSLITEDEKGNQNPVTFYGVNYEGKVAGVGSVEADGSDDSNAVYYNLQGVRVGKDSLTPGVYVRVAGGTATKVHVRQ